MRRDGLLVALTISAVVGLALPVSAADTITRRDGTRVSGQITGGSKTDLTIKPSIGDAVTVPASEIAAIDWDAATADLKLGITDETGGRLDSALQRVTKSKSETKTPSDLLRHEFDFVLARINARMALADASKQDATIALLEAFRKTGSDHFRFYEATNLLGQVKLAKGDFAGARTAFEALAQSPGADYKLAAKIAQGRILMGEGQNEQAAQTFEEAITSAGASPAEQARKYEAMLGKAKAQALLSQHAEALQVLDDVISKAPADITALQAEAYVLQGNSLQALNRNKEAVLAYLHVDLLFAREAGFHAESLYHMSRLWKTVQFPERGLDAEGKLLASYPNSPWAKKLGGAGN